MRCQPLLFLLLLTNALFSQTIEKGIYSPEVSCPFGGMTFEFDGKGNFEITKSSCLANEKGCGKYLVNDSILTLEYTSHPADTPLYKSTVKYYQSAAKDSIEVLLTVIDYENQDSLLTINTVYNSTRDDTKEISNINRSGQALNFKVAASSIPCTILIDFDYGYCVVEIIHTGNASLQVFAMKALANVSSYIIAGTTEKYKIRHKTQDGFFLAEGYWAYKRH
jgi:hypothetical protein